MSTVLMSKTSSLAGVRSVAEPEGPLSEFPFLLTAGGGAAVAQEEEGALEVPVVRRVRWHASCSVNSANARNLGA